MKIKKSQLVQLIKEAILLEQTQNTFAYRIRQDYGSPLRPVISFYTLNDDGTYTFTKAIDSIGADVKDVNFLDSRPSPENVTNYDVEETEIKKKQSPPATRNPAAPRPGHGVKTQERYYDDSARGSGFAKKQSGLGARDRRPDSPYMGKKSRW